MMKKETTKYLSDLGKKGGRARAQKLSKRQRSDIARLGGIAKAAKAAGAKSKNARKGK